MIFIYEVETDGDPIYDVFEGNGFHPADYRESFIDHNDLVTFLDKCTSDGVDFILHPLSDWIY